VGDLFHNNLRLRDETERARVDFIRTDLGVCLTLATVAETAYSMGHREHAKRTIASAEKGYSDMLRYFHKATGMTAEVEKELQSKFKQLRERLDGLQRLG
jgi:Ser/Thr protein kinase RdoA (MazF antagonist)